MHNQSIYLNIFSNVYDEYLRDGNSVGIMDLVDKVEDVDSRTIQVRMQLGIVHIHILSVLDAKGIIDVILPFC